MSNDIKNLDDIFGMDILDTTVIEESSTIPATTEGTNTPVLKDNVPEVKIPIPATSEITADAYNSTLGQLQKLMKESSEIMQVLSNVKIVQESVETLQERFTEESIENAIFESYMDGPIYEAVNNDNKSEIKVIAKKIKKKLTGLKRALQWYISGSTKSAGNRLGLLDPIILAKTSGPLKLYAWQTVCILIPKFKVPLGKALEDLNEEFAELLGDYELKVVKTTIFLTHPKEVTEDEKDKRRSFISAYILIVDNKDATVPENIEIKLDEKTSNKFNQIVDEVNADKA